MEEKEKREEFSEEDRYREALQEQSFIEYPEEPMDQNTRIYLGRSSGRNASANAGRIHYGTYAEVVRDSNSRGKKSKKQKKPSVVKLILKILLVLFMVLFLWADGLVMVQYVMDYNEDQDDTWYISGCDRDYYQGDYAGLRDYLNLYDLYSEDYDIYWERVNAYEDYIAYLQWSSTSDQILTGSAEKAEEYRQKVIDNASNCQFEKNRKALENWESLVE